MPALWEDDSAEVPLFGPRPHDPPVPYFQAAVVLCFFGEVVTALTTRPDARLLTTLTSVEGGHPVWAIDVDGHPVAVVRPLMGAPATVAVLGELIGLGGRCFVAVGGAGALLPDLVLGHAVIVSSAVRDEGTSFHYLPPSRTVDADPDGVDVLRRPPSVTPRSTSTRVGICSPMPSTGRCWAGFDCRDRGHHPRGVPRRPRRPPHHGGVGDRGTPLVAAVCRDDGHRFSKPVTAEIRLVAGLGVAGDAHAGVTVQHRSRVRADPTQPNLRQVHLMHAELFDDLAAAGYPVGPGDLGENITTSGVDLLGLPRGTVLRIGDEAVVEVTGLRNPCQQINEFRAGLLREVLFTDPAGRVVRRAGIMGVVVHSGPVTAGDLIRVERPEQPWQPLERV